MFKFGDAVFHELYGDGLYGRFVSNDTCMILFEEIGFIEVKHCDIVKVSDWILCSVKMPDSYTDVVFVDEYGKQFFGYFNNNDVIMSCDGFTRKEAYAWQYKQESPK